MIPKFRGKTVENGEWVYGYYCGCGLCADHSKMPEFWRVDPKRSIGSMSDHNKQWGAVTVYEDTVGMSTGLHDKNGVEIYEGDIVHIRDTYLPPKDEQKGHVGVVDFMDASFRVSSATTKHYRWQDYEVEVLFNIHTK